MIKNKKGGVILWIIIFGLIASLGFFFAIIIPQSSTEIYQGKQQIELLKANVELEQKLFYVDQSAKYSLEKSHKDYKEDNTTSLEKYFDKRFKTYLKSAPHGTNGIVVEYSYLILNDKFIGLAKSDLAHFTPAPGRVEYFVRPSFNIPLK